MVQVVGVRFKKAGKVYYFDPAEYPISMGAKVVVETARGVEYGEVAVGPKDVEEDQVVQPLKKVVRLGNEKDAVVAAENKRKEKEAYVVAQKKIQGHSLDMNLVDVEYTFDGSKIIFYFTAEGRVDFRELVRDLAGVFRTRIEMRQIGVRDEAKLLGGIGPCGRILCCTSFLGDFAPVSIRMAKDQNLSLNPSKISGLCGRLMCCLRYEQETYEAAKKDPTLAPGYVPPVIKELDAGEDLEDMDERPATPAIGIRRNDSGMSARIARAANIGAPVRREERPEERRGGQPSHQKGGQERGAQHGPRPQGGQNQPRPQGEQKGHQKPGQERHGGQHQKGQAHGQRPHGGQPHQQKSGQGKGQHQPRPQGEHRQADHRPAERPQEERQQGGQPQGQNHRRRNRHRHKGDRSGGGNPGAGGPQA